MKTERLIIRITPEQKAEIRKKAEKAGKSLSQFVIEAATKKNETVRTESTAVRTNEPKTVRTKVPDVRTDGPVSSYFHNKPRQ